MKTPNTVYDTADNPLPLYAQIAKDLRQGILSGTLAPGSRLPAVTELAETRGVTAATIRRALRDLTEEGLISSHVGRGTFVTEGSTRGGKSRHGTATGDKAPRETANGAAASFPGLALSARQSRADTGRDLRDLMALANRPGVIAFTRGIGDPETVEKGTLTRLAHEALEGGEEMFLDYGDPRGLLPLREAIANLYRAQGLAVGPEQVLVTSGSQQALALLAREAAETGTPVACEIPCYSGVLNAFEAFAVRPIFVERDRFGPLPEALQALDREFSARSAESGILYLCPILHNPMGTDVSPERRRAVTEWAKRTGSVVLADEIYRDLHLGPEAPPSLLADLGPERTIVLGSLSKSFISGLRVGWIVTSEERVRNLTAVKKAMDLGCPPLMQGIARVFLEDESGYAAHGARVRDHYRLRRDATLAALERLMPEGAEWTEPAGGFQLWLTLPAGYSATELLVRAVDEGVSFLPGALQAAGDRFDGLFAGSLRLCYGSLRPEEIEEGIGRLAKALRSYVSESVAPAAYAGLGDF